MTSQGKPTGWVGVDFDRTIATYASKQAGTVGKPIKDMVDRVKRWLAEGRDVRIVTARVSRQADDAEQQREMLTAWCVEHVGQALPITAEKDFEMVELWDDRAIGVVPNEGIRVDDAREDEVVGAIAGWVSGLAADRPNLAPFFEAVVAGILQKKWKPSAS